MIYWWGNTGPMWPLIITSPSFYKDTLLAKALMLPIANVNHVTYRKPPSLKDMLVRAKIPQPKTKTNKGCTRPNTCRYCTRLSQSGKITNLENNTTYKTITKGTCQSNNLIYCLECNRCRIKYVGQTKNRIIDRFQGHIYDIKHNNNTTVARHFSVTMIKAILAWSYIFLNT